MCAASVYPEPGSNSHVLVSIFRLSTLYKSFFKSVCQALLNFFLFILKTFKIFSVLFFLEIFFLEESYRSGFFFQRILLFTFQCTFLCLREGNLDCTIFISSCQYIFKIFFKNFFDFFRFIFLTLFWAKIKD